MVIRLLDQTLERDYVINLASWRVDFYQSNIEEKIHMAYLAPMTNHGVFRLIMLSSELYMLQE